MDRMEIINYERFLELFNIVASVILGLIFFKSIDTIYSTQEGKLVLWPTNRWLQFALHLILIVNLLIDWLSGNIRITIARRVSIFLGLGVVLFLLIEGYICILSLDPNNPLPILIFIIFFVGGGFLNDIYLFLFIARAQDGIYALIPLARIIYGAMLLLSYVGWRNTNDISGMLSILIFLTILKVIRLYFMPYFYSSTVR